MPWTTSRTSWPRSSSGTSLNASPDRRRPADDGAERGRDPDPVAHVEGFVAQYVLEPVLEVVVVGFVAGVVQALEGGPVPLLEGEEGAVAHHLLDEHVEQARPLLRRRQPSRRSSPVQLAAVVAGARRCRANRRSSLLAKW